MFGALMAGIRDFGIKLISSPGPISVGSDDEVQIVNRPQTWVDITFSLINRILRPALLVLILYMFYWFSQDPEAAKDWILVVKEIPSQMWDTFMVILVSLGLTKVIRDAKAPHDGPQVVLKQGTPGDGAAKAEIPADIPAEPSAPSTPETNPTLAAWKAAKESK